MADALILLTFFVVVSVLALTLKNENAIARIERRQRLILDELDIDEPDDLLTLDEQVARIRASTRKEMGA